MILVLSGRWSDEDKRSALITLSQFVLRRETYGIREDLHKNVVEIAVFLSSSGGKPVNLDDLKGTLKTELFGIQLPDSVMTQTINALVKENRVERIHHDELVITNSRIAQIERQKQEHTSMVHRTESRSINPSLSRRCHPVLKIKTEARTSTSSQNTTLPIHIPPHPPTTDLGDSVTFAFSHILVVWLVVLGICI